MRQALISAIVVSANDDGGLRLARLVEESGAAVCDTLPEKSEIADDMLRQYDIVIVEGKLPSINLTDLAKPLLFVGDFAVTGTAWLKNLPCPFGVLSPNPSPGTIAAALLSINEGLIVFENASALGRTGTPQIDLRPSGQRERPGARIYSGRGEEETLTLSKRESAVLDFFARGFSTGDTAEYLRISTNTVKYHTASIYSKLGVSTRAEAVSEGIRRGLIPI